MKKILIVIAAVVAAAAIITVARETRSSKSQVARDMTIFNSVLKELQLNYVDTIDSKKLVRNAIDYMLSEIDPYTEYYPEEDSEELTSISSGQYGGIGAYIQQRNGSVMISDPVYGAPARLAGLRHGDVILSIDGVDVSTTRETDKVSKMLRGQPGTNVRVAVRRPFVDDSLITVDIMRKTIEMDPMPYYGIDSTGIGYIRLNTFNERSAGEVRDALVGMKSTGRLKGLVLDLRDNGGGLLESAVQIAGLFVPKGTEIVRTRGYEDKNLKIYKTTKAPIDTELPLAVLVNGNTASASEIVAGSLQDLDRAVIVGDRSFGKGLVQGSRPLPYNGLMKVTVARYYIPSGRLIQAIDYSHRNPDGSPARIPDSLTNVWHTKNGRPVRDGGGITPDVHAADTSMNRLLYNVIADNWAFDFANRYRAEHPEIADADTWIVDDTIFEDFKKFIDPDKFKYDRMSETGVDFLRTAATAEGYMNDSVAALIDRLATLMRHDLGRDLDFNRERLVLILDDEIGRRYYSDGDLVKRSIRHDLEVDSAKAVVADRERYARILRPE